MFNLFRKIYPIIIFIFGALFVYSGLFDAFIDYWDDLSYLTIEHIQLVLLSIGGAILIGLPTGIILSRPFVIRFSEYFLQILNMGLSVPTLAVMAIALLFLGIGKPPAIFALWFCSLLPIVRNTYQGLLGVDKSLLEAARGQGMTASQIFWKIELPNSLFVIFAGIRTATAINVGTVPLAFLVGGGGLGELIFTGIDLNENTMMLVGAISVALLVIVADFIIVQFQKLTIKHEN